MRNYCYALAAALLTSLAAARPAHAQQPAALPAGPTPAPTGSLRGAVQDSAKNEAVPYATVVLLPAQPAAPEKPVTGVAADDQGRFVMEKVPPGTYRLRASYVGYATRTRPVTVAAGAPTEAGTLRLPAAATALAEAVVVGQKPVVEVRPDRMVYNAEQDVGNAGGTAQDVLRKTPLLAVDGDGNVKMRGSANFKVLVNNKPSPTMASNLAEALKSIPADQIKSVEVITTPPAKYDGEGTAGIINIVLKKGTNQGLNGRVGASTGNRNSSLGTALNFRQGKVNFTSSANVGAWYNPGEFFRDRTTLDTARQVASTLSQSAAVRNRGGWLYGTVGVDYDPKEHHALSLASSVNGYAGYSTNALLNQLAPVGAPNQVFFRDTKNVFNGLNVETTGTYTRTFADVPRKEWSVLAQYAYQNGLFGYDFDQYNNSWERLSEGQASYRERSRGHTPGYETTFQTDFTQPFGEKRTLEVGLKAIFRRTSSLAQVDTLRAPAADFAELTRRATDFGYGQDVQAAYGTYSFSVGKKLSASLGSRLERTGIQADFRTANTSFDLNYLTLLPNGSASYAFTEATSLRLAYSRRITRPFIDYLNPFVDRGDPANISFGNPELDPELTHSAELGFNTSRNATSLNASLSVRYTGNAIERVTRLAENNPTITEQTYGNVAANTFYQFNLYASLKPTENWSLSGGPDVQYIVRRSAALGTTLSGWTANLNFNTSYKLKHGWTLQAVVYSGLRTPELQGYGAANLYYQVGAKKMLMKDRADLTLNFATPFNAYWPYRNTLNTPFFNETFTYRAYQQGFRLNFNYRFGQQSQGRQRKSISNDDQKSGGSKQGGQ